MSIIITSEGKVQRLIEKGLVKMKKLSEFLVEKRLIILIIMLVLALVSAFFIFSTRINYDLREYLPEDSAMKTGLEIMDSEFDDPETSSIRLMVKGLDQSEKEIVLDSLEGIDIAIEILHDDTRTYNAGEYTLYVINVPDDAHSELAKSVLEEVKVIMELHDAYYGGDIPEATSNFLLTVIIWGFSLLLVLLVLFSRSWFEPVIFIINIGVAVLINYGTNMMFPSVSEITFTIAAVLQLVLSIDYSIMLSERYRQEKNAGSDNVTAMKNAIFKGISSISASSLTTVLGLTCLIFMSFTIGIDLGLVLAKGIFLSYVSAFTIMPALVIMFDKLIEKTRKKTPKVNLAKTAFFMHEWRYAFLGLFILLAAGGIFLNQFVGVDYFKPSMAEDSELVEKNFPTENKIIILYENDDETSIPGFVAIAEALEGTSTLESYATTLGKKQTAETLALALGIESDILEMIIYQYKDGTIADLTINQVLGYVIEDVVDNPEFSGYFDHETMMKLTWAYNFTSTSFIMADYDAQQLASMLEMDESEIDDLIMMYYVNNGEVPESSVVLIDFVGFLNQLAVDPVYSAMFDDAQKGQLQYLYGLMASSIANQTYDAEEMEAFFQAAFISLDPGMTDLLYLMYSASANYDETWTLTIDELMTCLVQNVITDEKFEPWIDQETKTMLLENHELMLEGKNQLVGDNYSRIVITSEYNLSDDEAIPYVEELSAGLSGVGIDHYLIGNSPMASEMNEDFLHELNFITILTAVVIFIVVMLTFKSLFVPLLLVLIIQTAIYLTMSWTLIGGKDLYFLSIVVVQAVLMGAAIDYAILFTSYYRGERNDHDIKTSLANAYQGSLTAILTSSIILIVITMILGFIVDNAAVASVLITLSRGMTISVLLTLIILPPLLVVFDKLVCQKKRKRQ